MAVTLDLMEWPSDAEIQAAYPTSEAEAVDQNFESGGDVLAAIGRTTTTQYWHAMRFTTSKTIMCSAASIYLESKAGTPTGDLTIEIQTDSSNKPSGTLAHADATKDIPNGSISVPAWNKVDFDEFSLPAGTYWIVAHIPSQGTDNYNWSWTADADGAGWGSFSVDAGSNWTSREIYISYFRIYKNILQCYSEDTIIQQGSYSLKGYAEITASLNDTLTRTVDPTIDLSDQNAIEFWIRSSRTGQNIKIGIHDAGGTTTEITPNILSANTWQKVVWNISAVTNANKDAIDSIIITIVNAD